LDGVGAQEGRIVVLTTNHPQRLDRTLAPEPAVTQHWRGLRLFFGSGLYPCK
jgi:hypothetical protein